MAAPELASAEAPHQPGAAEVPGHQRGHPCLFGADTLVPGEPAILVEGEFDTLRL
jgi:hypothetical protein